MPLTTANYSGGIIVTDWYSDNQNMRAVPLPDLEKQEEKKLDDISSDINIEDFAQKASEIGIDALSGKNCLN